MIKRAVILVLIMCLFPVIAGAADWYINGDCSLNGDGTSQECASTSGGAGAWNKLSYTVWGTGGVQAGDTLYLCSDTNTRTYVDVSGTAGNPITITALKGITPWLSVTNTYSGDWTDLGDGRFSHSGYTGYLMQDGIFQPKASDENLTDGVWYYLSAANATYYRPPTGTTPDDYTLTPLSLRAAFEIQGNDHFVFKNLNFHFLAYGINSDSVGGPENFLVTDCRFEDVTGVGVRLKGYGGEPVKDVTIRNCIFNRCAQDIAIAAHADGPERAENILIEQNKFYNTYYTNNPDYDWGDCNSGSDGETTGVQNGNGVIIRYNYSKKAYKGFVNWCATTSNFEGLEIYSNVQFDTYTYGVDLGTQDHDAYGVAKIYYNVFINNEGNGDKGILCNQTNANPVYIVDNTIGGYQINIAFGHDVGHLVVKNNISFGDNQLIAFYLSDSDSGNNDIDYNLYYPDGTNKFQDTYNSYKDFATWKTDTGYDQNSIVSNPLFTGYHIPYNSPAINAGTIITGIHNAWPNWAKDIDGDLVVNNKPDIGCDEYRVRPYIGSTLIIDED